jgi:hypothetical protein
VKRAIWGWGVSQTHVLENSYGFARQYAEVSVHCMLLLFTIIPCTDVRCNRRSNGYPVRDLAVQ